MSPEQTPVIDPLAFLKDVVAPVSDDTPQPIQEPPSSDKDKDKDKDKKKKEKEEQVAELRRAKDKAEKEAEDLKKKLQEIEGLAPLKKVADHIKSRFKTEKVDDEIVDKFIEHHRERKKSLTEKEKLLAQKEETIKLLDMEKSDEWINGYVKPVRESADSLLATIANIDEEGKIKNQEIMGSLMKELTILDKDGNPLNPIQVKQRLELFAKRYNKETGEDWDIPPLTMVVSAVKDYSAKIKKAAIAKQNWSKALEDAQKERLYFEAQSQQEAIAREITNRNFVTDKVIRGFDYDSLGGIVEEDEFRDLIRENNDYFIRLLKNDDKVQKKQYPDLLIEMAKAQKFDYILARYKELSEEVEKLREIAKGGLPHGGGSGGSRVSEKDDAVDPNEDPRAFLTK